MPHFLKESQYRWYLIGYDTDSKLKSFGVDRISAINILEDTQFLRDEHIDIPSLFRESYGNSNTPEIGDTQIHRLSIMRCVARTE